MMLLTNMCNLINYKSFIEINLCINSFCFILFMCPLGPSRSRPLATARSVPQPPARDRLVRPVDDHPLVVVRPRSRPPCPSGRRPPARGRPSVPGRPPPRTRTVGNLQVTCTQECTHFSYMYPMYPKLGTSWVQKVAPLSK